MWNGNASVHLYAHALYAHDLYTHDAQEHALLLDRWNLAKTCH